MEILDHKGLSTVVSLGHDWGAAPAQRLWLFHPVRVSALVLLNVGVFPVAEFGLGAVLAATTQAIGYGTYHYWRLYESGEAGPLQDRHIESVFTMMHRAKQDHMLDTLCTPDGMKNYLLANTKDPTAAYATPEMRRAFVVRMARDGFTAPSCWYTATLENRNYPVEKDLPPERQVVTVPTLFVCCLHDNVCHPAFTKVGEQLGLLPNLEVAAIDSSH